MSDAPPRHPTPVHVFAGVIGAALAAVLLVTIVGRIVGFSDIGDAIRGASFGWLAVCAAGQAAVFAGYAGALRHAIASDDGPRLPVSLSVRLVFASFAATQLFAFAGAAGMAVVYWVLRRVGLGRRDAAVRLIGLSTAVYLVFGLMGFAAAWWTLAGGTAPGGMILPWLIGFPIVIAAARWFTSPRRVARWTAPSDRLVRKGLATGVGAAAWVRRMTAAPQGAPLFAWAALYWVGDVASMWGALHAFGEGPHLGTLTLVYATGYLVQSLPIPLIATGGVDAATTVLLEIVGVPLEVALVAVIAHRIFAFWIPVIPGSIAALLLPRAGRAIDAVVVSALNDSRKTS